MIYYLGAPGSPQFNKHIVLYFLFYYPRAYIAFESIAYTLSWQLETLYRFRRVVVMALVITVLTVLCLILWYYLHIPLDFPKNIPSVPIYVSLLGLWSQMGQDEVYNRWLREPLERYGAVIYWFAGRWSILVTRPEYLTDMFRNEDIYAKAGNQKKIPWSVMAALLGDNIISAHGDNWKLYTSIMKPGIAKRVFDTRPLQDQSRKFVDLLLQAQSVQGVDNGLFPNQFIQRYAIAAMGESFLGTDFRVSIF